jgi:hypothetical protein
MSTTDTYVRARIDTSTKERAAARMLHKRCPVPPPGLDYAFFDFQAIVPPTPQAGRSVRSG